MGPIYVLPLSRLAREIAAIPNRGLEPQTEQSVIGTYLLSMPELDPCAPSATHNAHSRNLATPRCRRWLHRYRLTSAFASITADFRDASS
jgi:hypothetical protein